jgi:hypothetical protein
MGPRYPSLYQVNTRVWLTALSRSLGRPATLDDVPDADLDRWREQGFDWIWFLSVWRTGEKSRQVSRTEPGWLKEFRETLPDLREEDIGGSGFAIAGYTVLPDLGGGRRLGPVTGSAEKARAEAHVGFCAQPHGVGSPVGGGTS